MRYLLCGIRERRRPPPRKALWFCGRDVERVWLVSWRRPRAVRPERTRSARPSPAVFVFAFALAARAVFVVVFVFALAARAVFEFASVFALAARRAISTISS